MNDIQITLEAARVNAGMTQEQAAVYMGVDRSTIRRWEKGKKLPDIDDCKRLAKLYEIPLDFIFFGKKLAKSEKTKGIMAT